MEAALLIWVALVVGVAAGMTMERRTMHTIMKIKSMDGTGEYIDGQMYYILNLDDYCRTVLNIETSDEQPK